MSPANRLASSHARSDGLVKWLNISPSQLAMYLLVVDLSPVIL